MRNIKLTVSYEGSEFAGWQFQPGQKTIQGEIETAIARLTGTKTTLYAAGRTDAGVHSTGQVANFKTDNKLTVRKYREGINFYLNDNIRILKAEEVSLDFHARYDAVYRLYRYIIGKSISPLYKNREWIVKYSLDFDKLSTCANLIKGYHDFSTFCVVSSRKENNSCLVYKSSWKQHGEQLIYDIMADRFLHSMIRSLVGLMVEVASGKKNIKDFNAVFKSGDHGKIQRVAPAKGLCLFAVGY